MRSILLVLAMTGACAGPGGPGGPPEPVVAVGDDAPIETPEAAAVDPSIPLRVGLHRAAMTEVTLDPRGAAAVTLDADGGARLWPDLHARVPVMPVVLPFTEAAAVSLAQAGADSFVIAVLDTAGGCSVGEVSLAPGGPRWRSRFELPPTRPALEIHVLDAGERVLVLGLDHSLELRDRSGTLLSLLDPIGFIPWQLRVIQPPGQGAKIVAVLADPVRVQAIGLERDTLTVTGEALAVALDQGPNHSDLVLAPDGSFVLALRRPKALGRAFTLQRIELGTGERRWLAGELDGPLWPRLHGVDASRALLESGTGRGFWVDLDAATPTPPDGTPLLQHVPRVVPLPASTEATLMWSMVANGTRAVIDGDALVVGPLDGDRHRRLAAAPFTPRQVALDPEGSRLAWIAGTRLMTEQLGVSDSLHDLAEVGMNAIELAMVDHEHILVVGHHGEVSLRRWQDGEVVANATAPARWSMEKAVFRPGEQGGELALAPLKGRDPISLFTIDGASIGPRRDAKASHELGIFARAEYQRLRDLVKQRHGDVIVDFDRIAAMDDRRVFITHDPHERLYDLRAGELHFVDLMLRRAALRELLPAPVGSRLVLVEQMRMISAASVSVFDGTGPAPRKLWGRRFRTVGLDVRWSTDGTRLAVAGDGGWIFDADSGAVLHERHDLGLVATEAGNEGWRP